MYGGHFEAEKNWGAFWRLLTQKRAFSKSNLLLTLVERVSIWNFLSIYFFMKKKYKIKSWNQINQFHEILIGSDHWSSNRWNIANTAFLLKLSRLNLEKIWKNCKIVILRLIYSFKKCGGSNRRNVATNIWFTHENSETRSYWITNQLLENDLFWLEFNIEIIIIICKTQSTR